MSTTGLNASAIRLSFTATDLERSIRCYTEGLGFEIVQRHEVDGVLQYVSMTAGGAQIGLGRDDFAKGRDRQKGVGMRIWFHTTQELQPLAERARAAGIVLDGEVAPLPWGPLAFAFTDPDGFAVTVVNDG